MHQLWVSSHEQQICQVVVPGQVIFAACLSTAADPWHPAGLLVCFNKVLSEAL